MDSILFPFVECSVKRSIKHLFLFHKKIVLWKRNVNGILLPTVGHISSSLPSARHSTSSSDHQLTSFRWLVCKPVSTWIDRSPSFFPHAPTISASSSWSSLPLSGSQLSVSQFVPAWHTDVVDLLAVTGHASPRGQQLKQLPVLTPSSLVYCTRGLLVLLCSWTIWDMTRT